MTKRVVGVLVVIALVVAVIVWKTRGSSESEGSGGGSGSSVATSGSGSGSGSGKTTRTGDTALAPAAHLTVAVRDKAGPVADATVRIAPSDDDGEVFVLRTGRDGSVRSPNLEAGDYVVSASAVEHGPTGVKQTLKAGDDARLELVIPVGGATLSGLVTDATGGAIPGARVDAALPGGMRGTPLAVSTAMTGTDGRYKLSVAPGTLLVAVRSADYAPQSRYVVVTSAGATADFSLVPGGVIEGVVRDARTREPVANAHVVAASDSPGILLAESGGARETTTKTDGRFRIAGLRPGAYDLRADDGERSSITTTKIGLGVAEQVTDVELLIGTGPVIRGIVVDDAEAPVPDAAINPIGAERGGDRVKSGPDGRFVLAGLHPGRYQLMAAGSSYVPAGFTPVDLANKDVDGVTVRVHHGAKLVGHVEPRQADCEVRLDVSRSSLSNGSMPMILAPVETGDDGSFELGPASPGKAVVGARCASGDQGSTDVEAPASADIVIHVTPGGSIAGRVVDGSGKPVAAVTVLANPTNGTENMMIVNGMVASGAQALTGPDGGYEIKGLTADTYRVSVLDRGRPLAMKKDTPKVTLAANQHATGVDLAVDLPNGVIEGTVTGPDGKPVADAWVSASQDVMAMVQDMMGKPGAGDGESSSRMITMENDGGEGGGDVPPALTDASGHYKLVGLPHAVYDVVAEAQGGKLRARVGGVKPDAKQDLVLAGITTIKGIVKGASGEAPELFTVTLDGPTETRRGFATADGSFEIARVDPGDYHVVVSSSAGNGDAKVHVDAGQTATVSITLAGNAIVIGKLVDPAGKPMPNVGVAVVPDTGDGRVSISLSGPPPSTGPDGAFRIETKPGPSVFLALTPPRPFTKMGLVLEAGKTTDLGAVTVTPDAGPPHPPHK